MNAVKTNNAVKPANETKEENVLLFNNGYGVKNVKKRLFNVRKWDIVAHWHYYVMLAPTIILYFLFTYMAMPGILLAFKRYTLSGGIFFSPWVGMENFVTFIQGPYFFRTLRNTVVINLSNLVVSTVSSIVFALMMNELFNKKAKKIYQNILFLPTFFSVLLISKFLMLLFSNDKGLINQVLQTFGFDAIAFYNEPGYWVPILVFTYLWKGVGYNLIVYLAAMSGIDSEIYEAATVDGAGRWKQITRITLPLLIPTIIMLTLFSIGRVFYGDFLMIYSIIGNNSNIALYESIDIIETYLFRMVTGATPDYGVAGAVGLIQTVLGFVMIFGSNLLVKLYNKDYALF